MEKIEFRLATYGDLQSGVTHAICRHGIITKITDDHHSCTWTKLVKQERNNHES